MEVEKLKEYLTQRLENLTDIPVYDGKVPDDAVYPYLVYKLEGISYLERTRKDLILEIDYWVDSYDISGIVEASRTVKNGRTVLSNEYIGLDYSIQDETEGFYRCFIEFEGEISDSEPNISRYIQRYILYID